MPTQENAMLNGTLQFKAQTWMDVIIQLCLRIQPMVQVLATHLVVKTKKKLSYNMVNYKTRVMHNIKEARILFDRKSIFFLQNSTKYWFAPSTQWPVKTNLLHLERIVSVATGLSNTANYWPGTLTAVFPVIADS